MTASNGDRCIANTLVYEGGFGRTRADRGDWTSGQIGVGELKGTAYGIAAMTLKDRGLDPNMDLSKLTRDQAIQLYKAKEWRESFGDEWPKGVDQVTFDAIVNSGKGRMSWTVRACGAANTLQAIQIARAADTETRRAMVKKQIAIRLAFLRSLAIAPTFIGGWTKRCVGMEAIGVKMVLEDAGLAPAVRQAELEKEAGVSKKKATASTTAATGTGAAGGGAVTQAPDPSALDWSQIIGVGVVSVAVIALVVFLAYQAFKNFHRNNAYLAAAKGDIGG